MALDYKAHNLGYNPPKLWLFISYKLYYIHIYILYPLITGTALPSHVD